MTITDELKIRNDKIKTNQAQSKTNLDRETAKHFALSSGELEKYEYLSGEDLGYKLGVIEKAKFEYLYWVNFLVKNWMKKIKKTLEKDLKILKARMKSSYHKLDIKEKDN